MLGEARHHIWPPHFLERWLPIFFQEIRQLPKRKRVVSWFFQLGVACGSVAAGCFFRGWLPESGGVPMGTKITLA